MSNSIKNYLVAIVKSPLAVLKVLIQIILLIIWALIMLLVWLYRRKKKRRNPCSGEIPEYVKRRPDPCIYSQTYLMERGLPVTWNNPDIQLTELDGTLVPSSSLLPDHDYRVVGTISNASFDAALGVSVRCVFRNWGVGGPFEPMELDPGGNEVAKFVHIGPHGQKNTAFLWHTPPQAGHYCLKVICAHPDDLNTANNTGQENTNVVEAKSGSSTSAMMQVANPSRKDVRMRFRIDTYKIPDREWNMELETIQIPLGDRPLFGGNPKESHSVFAKTRRWALARRRVLYRHSRYLGRGELFAEQREARTPMPENWRVEIDGANPAEGIVIGPREVRDVEVRVTLPASAEPGSVLSINIGAWEATTGPLGGVTLQIRVRDRG